MFESMEAGYLEQCAINTKQSLNGQDVPSQVNFISYYRKSFQIYIIISFTSEFA